MVKSEGLSWAGEGVVEEGGPEVWGQPLGAGSSCGLSWGEEKLVISLGPEGKSARGQVRSWLQQERDAQNTESGLVLDGCSAGVHPAKTVGRSQAAMKSLSCLSVLIYKMGIWSPHLIGMLEDGVSQHMPSAQHCARHTVNAPSMPPSSPPSSTSSVAPSPSY